jgi:hypothetical protein
MTKPPPPAALQNPRTISLAGGLLFALALLSFALLYTKDGATAESVKLAGGVGLLMGMGYPALLYAGTLRRLAALEARIRELESRSGSAE